MIVLKCVVFAVLVSTSVGDKLKLVQKAGTLPVGAKCTQDEDCLDHEVSTRCHPVLGACYCRDEFEPYKLPDATDFICIDIKNQLGDPCYIDSQCTKGKPGELSSCLPSSEDPAQQVCTCKPEAINEPGEHKCYEKRSCLGQPCDVNAQCQFNMTEYSECKNNECACKTSIALPSPTKDKCLAVLHRLGQDCEIKEQCTEGTPGPESDCMELWQNSFWHKNLTTNNPPRKICNCTQTAINEPFEHVCYPRRDQVDAECQVNAQCQINLGMLSECQGSFCKCLKDEAVPSTKKDFCLPIVNIIGGECKESQQCTAGTPGDSSACMNSTVDPTKLVCNCTDDAIDQPGKHECLKKALKLKDQCVEQAQCTANLGGLSQCVNGACQCQPDSIPNLLKNHCLAIRHKIGEECQENQQCTEGTLSKYSTCVNNTCQCAPNGVAEPGENVCRRKAEQVGDMCLRNQQCKANLGNLSECVTGRFCRCLPNYAVASKDNSSCLPIRHLIGDQCLEPQQCQHGTPGNQSTCKNNTCICGKGSTNQPGSHKCYEIAEKVGAACEIDMQCQQSLGNLSECNKEKTCQCLANVSIEYSKGTECLPIVNQNGGECKESTQCTNGTLGDWSECRRSDQVPTKLECQCKPDAIKDRENEVCYRKAEHLGEKCAIDLQCTTNLEGPAYCNANTESCDCQTGYVGNMEGTPKTKCIPGDIYLGQPCFDLAQCAGSPNVTSTCGPGGRCTCLENFVQSIKLDTCLPIRNRIGDQCTEPQQCQQGVPGVLSTCLEMENGAKVCNCTDIAINQADKHKCYLKANFVGDPCQVNEQCVVNLNRSQCLNGNCECMANNRPSTNGSKCLEMRYLAEPCMDNNQCNHLPNAICSMDAISTCQCASGYIRHPSQHLFPNRCIKLATQIGESCSDHANQCKNLGATCNLEGTCECNPNSEVPSQDRTSCLKILPNLNDECLETQQCEVQDSVCWNSRCTCKPNDFVEAEFRQNLCLAVRFGIGDPCQEAIQCITGINNKTECISNTCRCTYPTEFFENYCYQPVKLHGFCSQDPECRLGVNQFAKCDLNERKCVCTPPAFSGNTEKCWLNKKVGSPCQEHLECTVSILGASQCDMRTNTCQCQPGYKSSSDNLYCGKDDKGGQTMLKASVVSIVLSTFIILSFTN